MIQIIIYQTKVPNDSISNPYNRALFIGGAIQRRITRSSVIRARKLQYEISLQLYLYQSQSRALAALGQTLALA